VRWAVLYSIGATVRATGYEVGCIVQELQLGIQVVRWAVLYRSYS
jgi:hypothetical protein